MGIGPVYAIIAKGDVLLGGFSTVLDVGKSTDTPKKILRGGLWDLTDLTTGK